MVDIISLLEEHGIKYVASGPNVAKGNVNIKCPFCGPSDKSEHLGIKLSSGVWGCWRSSKHRGKSLVFLFQKLLGISHRQAVSLLGEEKKAYVHDEDSLEAIIEELSMEKKRVKPMSARAILLPPHFRLMKKDIACTHHLHYLQYERGFKNPIQLAKYYGFYYTVKEDFRNRIIMPVRYKNCIVTYTARSITNSDLRYLSLEKGKSSISVKETVYNFDLACSGGKVLFLVEGPFDALKLDWYGKDLGARAVALFNMNMEKKQRNILSELLPLFEKVVIILDKGMEEKGDDIYQELFPFHKDISIGTLPKGVKDPGDLNPKQIRNLIECLF